ncbi:hypothetical protein VNO77_04649 [Canavalia gladiata]|uniref:Cytochrome P450 n=1 Tax=Canavalia gladiata TaxID=3824 RepID=A0AAN9N201_CANGL
MEVWFITVVSICVCPPHIPIITNITWLLKSFEELEPSLLNLHAKYGPIITLRFGSRPLCSSPKRSILLRPPQISRHRHEIISSDQHSINSTGYGDTWRTLRRNLSSEILHPSRIKSFSRVRRSVLQTLLTLLKSDSNSNPSVKVIDHFLYAMFCLLVFMCFGERVTDEKIGDIERVLRQMLVGFSRFNILNFWPQISRILFHKRWEELLQCRNEQEDVLITLIRATKQAKEAGKNDEVVSYVDSLLDLQVPEEKGIEKRKLTEEEIVTLCTEFLTAGTDTTSTVLQWVMANLVKNPHVQERLLEEIKEMVGEREDKEVKEEDVQKMPYLKAVIYEALRRHPPGHFVLPHTVTKEIVLNDYLIPKNGMVNFMVANMGLDPKVWKDPMEFKPERFLNDPTFWRICPGYNLAMLHLALFLANLIWNFEWKVPEGGHVDLTEKEEFTVMMKYPLQVHLSSRIWNK